MKLIADPDIPLVQTYLGPYFEITYQLGQSLTQRDLKHCDVLICRSNITVDRHLVANTGLSVIATPSSGDDHVKRADLAEKNLSFYSAKGCNAPAVADYIISVLTLMRHETPYQRKPRIGIIGVGAVGSQVLFRCEQLGFECITCDPIRAQQENTFRHHPLETIEGCDYITLHTPLNHGGAFPTYHLINEAVVSRQQPDCVIINAARGDVLDPAVILKDTAQRYCLDVYPHEPEVNPALVSRAAIATPHIAGHAIESKARGTWMIAQQILQHFQLPAPPPFLTEPGPILRLQPDQELETAILKAYDPRPESHALKSALPPELAQQFTALRKAHTQRHEFSSLVLQGAIPAISERARWAAAGFSVF